MDCTLVVGGVNPLVRNFREAGTISSSVLTASKQSTGYSQKVFVHIGTDLHGQSHEAEHLQGTRISVSSRK